MFRSCARGLHACIALVPMLSARGAARADVWEEMAPAIAAGRSSQGRRLPLRPSFAWAPPSKRSQFQEGSLLVVAHVEKWAELAAVPSAGGLSRSGLTGRIVWKIAARRMGGRSVIIHFRRYCAPWSVAFPRSACVGVCVYLLDWLGNLAEQVASRVARIACPPRWLAERRAGRRPACARHVCGHRALCCGCKPRRAVGCFRPAMAPPLPIADPAAGFTL